MPDAWIAAGLKLRGWSRLGQSDPLTGQQNWIRRDYAAQAAQSALGAKSALFASVGTPIHRTPLMKKTRWAAAQSSFVPISSMVRIGTNRAIFGVMVGVASPTAGSYLHSLTGTTP